MQDRPLGRSAAKRRPPRTSFDTKARTSGGSSRTNRCRTSSSSLVNATTASAGRAYDSGEGGKTGLILAANLARDQDTAGSAWRLANAAHRTPDLELVRFSN
jgi:hypothetical protein